MNPIFPGATEKNHRILIMIFCLRADTGLEGYPNANHGMIAQFCVAFSANDATETTTQECLQSVASGLLHKDSRHLAELASTEHILAVVYRADKGKPERKTNIKADTI
jgi:hypothetical protein